MRKPTVNRSLCVACGKPINSLATWREKCPTPRNDRQSSHAAFETHLRDIREREYQTGTGDYAGFAEMS